MFGSDILDPLCVFFLFVCVLVCLFVFFLLQQTHFPIPPPSHSFFLSFFFFFFSFDELCRLRLIAMSVNLFLLSYIIILSTVVMPHYFLTGDRTIHGFNIREQDGHYNDDWKPKDFNTKLIYLSPSMKYAGCDVYAKKER